MAVVLVLSIGGAQRYGKNCLMDAQRMALIAQNGKKRGESCCPRAIIPLTFAIENDNFIQELLQTNHDMKHLFLTIALLLAACGGSWAKSIKNKHVILIGLDGWGAYSVPKALLPYCPAIKPKRARRSGETALQAACSQTTSALSAPSQDDGTERALSYGKCRSTLHGPVQRTPMTNAARCIRHRTALHFSSLSSCKPPSGCRCGGVTSHRQWPFGIPATRPPRHSRACCPAHASWQHPTTRYPVRLPSG